VKAPASAPDQPKTAPARRIARLGALISLGGFVLTLAASRVTGPTFDEERRIAAVRRATELIRAVAEFGPMALGSSSGQAVYEDIAPFGPVPSIISGWPGEVLANANLLDRLVAARLGWLLFTGLAPAAVFFLCVRSRGPRVAALAACILLSIPRWIHAAAVAREPAVVASIWLMALSLYVQAMPPPLVARRGGEKSRYRLAAIGLAVVVGLGLSTSLATLWVLPLIIGHAIFVHWRSLRRLVRQGLLPVPVGVLLVILIAPVTMVAATPSLWRGGGAHAAQWLLTPLSPTIEPLLYHGGPVVSARDVPGGYALRWLIATTPALVLVLGLAGAVLLAVAFWKNQRQRRDPYALGALLALAVAAIVIGPAITPAVLTRFPPRIEAALPFIAVAAAIAVERAAIRLLGEARSLFAVLASGLAFLAFGLFGLPTASASFGLFGGGTARAVASRMWTVGDGSEVAALALAIDRLGVSRLFVDGSEVPRSYWTTLQWAGRLRTRVEVGRGGPLTMSVHRGDEQGAIATVTRDGAVLWSLAKR
jgi:hypothetical protein